MEHNTTKSRRAFLYQLSLAGLSIPLASSTFADEQKQTTMQQKKEGKLGIALVGLGGYAGGQLAPALQQTEHCYLAGIVTGTPSKIPVWKEKYNIPDKNIYNYDNYDSIKDNPDIDIIYVVLPNSMHAEYVIRGFAAGKHVICEKPMALTVADCDKMIAASKKAGKQLSVGYRLQFEPHNLEMMRLGTTKVYGDIKKMTAGFGFMIGDPTQWRLKKDLAGGGPMQDLGIYCVQGLCYTTGMIPVSVTAQEGPKTIADKFKEVEQSLKWQFEMPNGLMAEGEASYGSNMNFLRAEAEKGMFELSPAYNYGGLRGKTPEGPMNFTNINQQAKQMDAMALSMMKNQPSIASGEMGRRDVKLITSVYEAMATGKKIKIQ
ncbi:Gfo/Idh/MocA family protein [Lacibacter sp. H407]|uniref:Gfo/Idh/MocA family protein n=1 Tax=Lacibacter sp. H407 TaxID=3133423 RepID=UPI0030C0DD00